MEHSAAEEWNAAINQEEMVAELGVEPRLSESESLVLPLHHSA